MILKGPCKGVEPRVLVFWPRARLSYLATPRLIGESAILVAGMAICMDFGRKMGDFEAAWQRTLTQGTSIFASRATQLLSNSSAHR